MVDRQALSKAEMAVARVLWDLGQATVREVHAALPQAIEFATVQTYLRRLEKKGYISGKLDGRTRIYSPRVKPKTVIRETLDDLVNRLFGGQTLPLVKHLIEERGFSDTDLAELRELIDRMEKENR